MPFNYNQNFNAIQADPRIIEGASNTPFSIAGKAMTQLDNAIENRAFEKSIGNAKGLNDLTGLTPKTKEQQAIFAAKQGIFNAQALQETRGLQNQLAQGQIDMLPTQQAIADSNLLTNQLAQQEAERAFNMRQEAQRQLQGDDFVTVGNQNIVNQKGLESLGLKNGQTTPFNALSLTDRISAERQIDPKGNSATFDILKAQATGTGRKPTSFEEKDRWFKEYQTLRNTPNRTSGQEERMSFLNDGITAFNYGVTENKQIRAESEMAQDFATTASFIENKDYLSKPSKVTKTDYGRMDAIENRNMANKENPSVKATQEKIDGMSGNHKTINELQNVFNMESNGDFSKVNKGLYGNLAQGLSKMTTGDLQTDEMLDSMRQQINLDTRVGLIQAEFIKAISGATVSDTERAILLQGVTGGTFPTMDAMMTNLKAFQSTLVERNDLYAGQIFDVAPKSATKYRRYENLKKKENKTPKKSVTIVDYSTAFR